MVNIHPNVGHNAADVEIAKMALEIERFRTKRQLFTVVIVCGTILFALWSPVLAGVFAAMGLIFAGFLLRVEHLAKGITAASATAGMAGIPTADAAAPLATIALLVIILIPAAVVPKPLSLQLAHIEEPVVISTNASVSTDQSSNPQTGGKSNVPQSPEEQRVWDVFAATLELGLTECDRTIAVPDDEAVYYRRAFTLSCFECPIDGIASKLSEPETNATPLLATCYSDMVDGLLYKYVFPMPEGVKVLDNYFSHSYRGNL